MIKTFQDPELEIARLKRYEKMVEFIANEYVELSHDKIKCQYFYWKNRCKKLIEEDSEGCDGLAMHFYDKPKDDF